MDSYFLDTNILLRQLLADHSQHSPLADQIFESIARGQIQAHINTLVLHETTYVLEKVYQAQRKDIYSSLTKLLQLENLSILDLDKSQVLLALKDYRNTKVDFPDCIYKQLCQTQNLKLMSFDTHFNKLTLPTHQSS